MCGVWNAYLIICMLIGCKGWVRIWARVSSKPAHTHTHTHTHMRTHSHTHAHMHTHIHKCTHTYTHRDWNMLSRSNSHLTAYGKKRLFAQLAQRKQASPLLWSNITGCTFRSSCFTTSQVTAIKQSDCHKQQSSCLLRQILAIHSISALCAPTYTLNARPRPHQHSY